MTIEINQKCPESYFDIDKATKENGFTMPSDFSTCSLLRTLAASKPSSKFLELGTGTGLSTSWILDGMDNNSTLISIDNDATLLAIAQQFLGHDTRLSCVLTDGEDWVKNNISQKFDYIFADKKMIVKSFKNFSKLNYSDHYPIITRLAFKDN